ncbi:chemotaxis protein CheA [Gottschalkia purinilytica]|uniref:Chemotaxis protein CheA n=1 Tax=Gottschalkia purinilytica TaxID=1503 RepID=A0A0L0WBH7_GOTPU|nr:chemotaxis protein CheA [Gottschalkia purinilytica]KNF08836.1 chemotaxis protein CheA [Gottschalkia purinilytica]
MDMNQYLDIFIEESREHLQYMNEHLLSLEKNPNEKSLLNEIFRVAHTLKGMSGTMGFTRIANLTHEMENLLDALRNDKVAANSHIIDILFRCFDSLDEYLNNIIEMGQEGELDSTGLVGEINSILNGDIDLQQANDKEQDKETLKLDEYTIKAIKSGNENNLNAYQINVKISEECMLKSARAFIVFTTLEESCEILHSNPPAEDIEDEKFDLEFTLVVVSSDDKKEIRDKLLSISEIASVDIEEVEITSQSFDNNEKMKQETASIDVKPTEIIQGSKTATQDKKKNITKSSNKIGKTVRVDIDRLDNLMNLVSELIIIKTRLEDTGNTQKGDMNEAIEYLERITTSLHDAVMKVRMVPIERVFNRFPRMVRDLTKDLGKDIELVMSGEETEVDRTIIDEIGDPLIHLIRNSIDHGIESPEIREQLGKNKTGILDLKAYADGNNVVIELDDDGSGLNLEKIKKKAVERGLISEYELNEMSKEDAIDLLFKPGFSTAETVSDLSGRGVGLDVVKTKIESISGNVEVKTEQGIGTKFIIRLPLTLAIIQALLINIGEEIYAIPLSSISEISSIKNNEIRKIQNQEVVLFRNKTLPIIRLNSVLGIEDSEDDEERTIVIVRKGDKEAGLIIDNLIGQQEIVIKSLGKFLSDIPYLSGATILGNGKISLILDVNSLF